MEEKACEKKQQFLSDTDAIRDDAEELIEALRDCYLAQDTIAQGLSGRSQKIIDSYINLSIVSVEEQSQREAAFAEKRSSETGRSDVGTHAKEDQYKDERLASYEDLHRVQEPIALEAIFEPGKTKGTRLIKRILMLGRAGIGKTTLCHYVAYRWAKGELWPEFKYLFWLPLRRLVQTDYKGWEDLTLATVLHYECCGGSQLSSLGAISKILAERSSEVLLLLDGYDEVAALVKDEHRPVGRVLQEAFNYPKILVTSRPYPTPEVEVDRQLECMGLSNDSILSYVSSYFEHPEVKAAGQGESLRAFLKSNPSIWGTAHVPINLALICTAWEQALKDGETLNVHLQVTGLYQTLVHFLLKRFLERRGEPIQDKERSWFEVRFKKVTALIEALALAGLEKNELILSAELQHEVLAKLDLPESVFEEALSLGLLQQGSEVRPRLIDRSHYFIHLTFQEFFAARYLVKGLKEKSDSDAHRAAVKFIREEKYSARYQVVFWFMSGLLSSVKRKRALWLFWETLLGEPRDLVGVAHVCLVIRCLDEAQCDRRIVQGEALLKDLEGWVTALAFNHVNRKAILLALVQSSYLLNYPSAVEPQLLQGLLALSRDQDNKVRREAVGVLGGLANTSQAVESGLLVALGDEDGRVGEAAARVLYLAQPSPAVESGLLAALGDEHQWVRVRVAAAEVLGHLAKASPAVESRLLAALRDEEWQVRRKAVEALSWLAQVSPTVESELLAALRDEEWQVRLEAVEALRGLAQVSPALESGLLAALRDEEWQVRRKAVEALSWLAQVSPAVESGLLAALRDENQWVRVAVAEALRRLAQASPVVESGLLAALRDKKGRVRWRAAEALGRLAQVSPAVEFGLLAALRDEKEREGQVRVAAVEALGRLAQVSPAVESGLLAALRDDRWDDVRVAAAEALGRLAQVSPAVESGLLAALRDKKGGVRRRAAEALRRLAQASPAVEFGLLAALRHDRCDYVRAAVARALGGLAQPSEAVEPALLVALRDKEKWVRVAAAKALGRLAKSSETVMLKLLRDWQHQAPVKQYNIVSEGFLEGQAAKVLSAWAEVKVNYLFDKNSLNKIIVDKYELDPITSLSHQSVIKLLSLCIFIADSDMLPGLAALLLRSTTPITIVANCLHVNGKVFQPLWGLEIPDSFILELADTLTKAAQAFKVSLALEERCVPSLLDRLVSHLEDTESDWVLTHQSLKDNQVLQLAALLKENPNLPLKSLHLDANKITDKGACALAQALHFQPYLVEISLSQNLKLTDNSVKAFMSALQADTDADKGSLYSLNFSKTACSEESLQALQLLLRRNRSWLRQGKRLLKAVRDNDFNGVKRAIKAGALKTAATKEGYLALHVAAQYGYADLISQLLDDRNPLVRFKVDELSRGGLTAFYVACLYRQWGCANLLLSKGANPGATDILGRTLLHHAAMAGDITLSKYLLHRLKAGLDLNALDKAGRTPLHVAVAQGNEACVWYLLKQGVSCDVRDRAGDTARDLAGKSGNATLMAYFKNSPRVQEIEPSVLKVTEHLWVRIRVDIDQGWASLETPDVELHFGLKPKPNSRGGAQQLTSVSGVFYSLNLEALHETYRLYESKNDLWVKKGRSKLIASDCCALLYDLLLAAGIEELVYIKAKNSSDPIIRLEMLAPLVRQAQRAERECYPVTGDFHPSPALAQRRQVTISQEDYDNTLAHFRDYFAALEEGKKDIAKKRLNAVAWKTLSLKSPAKLSLLQGNLPGQEESLYLREEKVLGDGNCGFTTLGTDRNQVTEALATLANDPKAREALSEEIREALMTEQFTTQEGARLLHMLYHEQGKENKKLGGIRVRFTGLPHFTEDTLGKTIDWLNDNGALEEAESLRQISLHTFQAENALLLYCKGPDAFRSYVNELERNQSLWLGFKSALLYAKAKGITLYIWTKSETNPSKLELQDHTLGKNAQIIHMLSTGRFTHFNLLVIETMPLEENESTSVKIDKNLPTQKIPVISLKTGQPGGSMQEPLQQGKSNSAENVPGLGFSSLGLQLDVSLLSELSSSVEELLVEEESTTIVQNYLHKISSELGRINKQLANKNPHFRDAGIERIQAQLHELQGHMATVEKCATPTNKKSALAVLKSLEEHYEELLEKRRLTARPLTRTDETKLIRSERALAKEQQRLTKDPSFIKLLEKIKAFNAHEGKLIFISHAWCDEGIEGNTERDKWVSRFLRVLYSHLTKLGFRVCLDLIDIQAGDSKAQFMQENISRSDYVLLIGTEVLLKKSQPESNDNIKIELSLINTKRLTDLKKGLRRVIPVVLTGSLETALPLEFHDLVGITAQVWSSTGYLKGFKALFEKLGNVSRENKKYLSCWADFKCSEKEKKMGEKEETPSLSLNQDLQAGGRSSSPLHSQPLGEQALIQNWKFASPLLISVLAVIIGYYNTKLMALVSIIGYFDTKSNEFPPGIKNLCQKLINQWEHSDRKEKMELYTPPFVERKEDKAKLNLLESIRTFLSSNSSRSLVVLGTTGAGKSTNALYLTYVFMNEYMNNPLTNWLPLYIYLPAINSSERQTHLLPAYLSLKIKSLGLNEEQKNEILSSLDNVPQIVLFNDGFDEMTSSNLWRGNGWDPNRYKVITFCSSEILLKYPEGYTDLFCPVYPPELIPFVPDEQKRVQELILQPFNADQRNDFLQRYVKFHNESSATLKKYHDTIETIPGLKELVSNPFLLWMFATTRNITHSEPSKIITRNQIFEKFVTRWFEEEALRLSHDKILSPPNSSDDVNIKKSIKACLRLYTENLACRTLHNGTVNMILEAEDTLAPSLFMKKANNKACYESDTWLTEQNTLIAMRSGSLLKMDENYISFLHKSLVEYFVACVLSSGIGVFCSENKVVAAQRDNKFSCPHNEGAISELFLNEQLITEEPGILQVLADVVKERSGLEMTLFDIIECSKKQPVFAIAAANAITILNQARIPLSGKDFRDIRIPGADLSYALLSGTDLTDADLSRVKLRHAHLAYANFSRTNLQEVDFGERPALSHFRAVRALCYSAEGERLVVGDEIGTITVWNATSGELINTKGLSGFGLCLYSTPGDTVLSVSVIPEAIIGLSCHPKNPSWVAVSYRNANCIRLWNIEKNQYQYHDTPKVNSLIIAVAYNPNGRQLASVCKDGTVQLWEVGEGQSVSVKYNNLKGVASISTLAFSWDQDGQWLALGGPREVYLLKRIGSGYKIEKNLTGSGASTALAFSPNGKLLASAGGIDPIPGGKLTTGRIWNLASDKSRPILEDFTEPLGSCNVLAFSSDSEWLALSYSPGILRLQKLSSFGKDVIAPIGTYQAVAFSPDKKWLALGGVDGRVHLWNWPLTDHHLPRPLTKIPTAKTGALSPDGKWLASSDFSGVVRLWNMYDHTCRILRKACSVTLSKNIMAFSFDGTMLAIACYRSNDIQLWDTNTFSLRALLSFPKKITAVSFSPNEKWLAAGNEHGNVDFWDLTNYRPSDPWNSPVKGSVNAMSFSRDGKWALAIQNTLHIYDMLKSNHQAFVDKIPVSAVTLSLSGKWLAFTYDGAIWIRDLVKNTFLNVTLPTNIFQVRLEFSPDDKFLAVEADGYVWIWDFHITNCYFVLPIRGGLFGVGIIALYWSKPGQLIITDNHLQLFVWQMPNAIYPRPTLIKGSSAGNLTCMGLIIENAKMSSENYQLLKQCGAIDDDEGELKKRCPKFTWPGIDEGKTESADRWFDTDLAPCSNINIVMSSGASQLLSIWLVPWSRTISLVNTICDRFLTREQNEFIGQKHLFNMINKPINSSACFMGFVNDLYIPHLLSYVKVETILDGLASNFERQYKGEGKFHSTHYPPVVIDKPDPVSNFALGLVIAKIIENTSTSIVSSIFNLFRKISEPKASSINPAVKNETACSKKKLICLLNKCKKIRQEKIDGVDKWFYYFLEDLEGDIEEILKETTIVNFTVKQYQARLRKLVYEFVEGKSEFDFEKAFRVIERPPKITKQLSTLKQNVSVRDKNNRSWVKESKENTSAVVELLQREGFFSSHNFERRLGYPTTINAGLVIK